MGLENLLPCDLLDQDEADQADADADDGRHDGQERVSRRVAGGAVLGGKGGLFTAREHQGEERPEENQSDGGGKNDADDGFTSVVFHEARRGICPGFFLPQLNHFAAADHVSSAVMDLDAEGAFGGRGFVDDGGGSHGAEIRPELIGKSQNIHTVIN